MKKVTFSKILSRLIRGLLQPLELLKVIPPYDYVQRLNEQSVHKYLRVSRKDLKRWVIVGGFMGNEIPFILKNYPNCQVVIFECSERYATALTRKYRNNPRVVVIEKAVSNTRERIKFFETSLPGSGSLLSVGQLAEEIYEMEQAESFMVQSTTLDEVFKGSEIDVLQIDVQGAELSVIEGGSKVLSCTKAIFTEISVHPDLYNGSVEFDDLDDRLKTCGFTLALMGTDEYLTGNALYLNSHILKGVD